ncbi:hypothetical protein M8J76_004090 [Diaphorina citri]|nr:hypothetical protein M8J75_007342 [Diaphorina citri]KAI5723307.1 hypothetical protein M8J76_004090 [Diaphorina citri]
MSPSIRESATFIAQNSTHVKINDGKISEFCEKLFSNSKIPDVNFNHPLHPDCKKDKDFMDWIFVIDSLNFCFWKSPNQVQWSVTYEDVTYTGYFALCAALKKAKDNGINISDPKVNVKLSIDQFKDILKGDNEALPHLVEERHKFLVENSNILIGKYQGSFENVVKKANSSATKLLSIVIEDFPMAFYKRAQILVADLHFCANSTSAEDSSELNPRLASCTFHDIHELTMFADYRVPQVLKYFGILEYSETLMKALNQTEFKDPDSTFESELRGNSIEAVERIVATMRQLNGATEQSKSINAVSVDVFLWNYRREHVEEIDREPYHRVISVYY